MAQLRNSVQPDNPGTAWQVQDGVLHIVGMDVTLDQTDMGYATPPDGIAVEGTLDIVVQAQTVSLPALLINPGRRITIVAHRLVVSPGAGIDVSGATGAPNYDRPPYMPDPTDLTPGAKGPNGADGGNGGDGGSILLYAAEVVAPAGATQPPSLILKASGGAGGHGQSGGLGQQGAIGERGVTPVWNGKPGTGPGWGGEGGAGGDAGNGGDGGAGGTISVNLVTTLDPSRLVLDHEAGAAGPYGLVGPAGPGGPPCQGVPAGFGISGLGGAGGRSGRAGTAGTATVTPAGGFTAADLGQQATLALLQMVQQAADSAFLGQDYATAVAIYKELIAMTAPAAAQAAGSVGAVSADIAARAAINRACVCELSRLRQGLDFFGLRPDWAPTLTLALLQAEIEAMLTLAGQLDQSLGVLLTQEATAEARQEALLSAQSQAAGRVSATQAQIEAQEGQLTLFIASLDRQQQEIDVQLMRIEAMQFYDLFAQQHSGCTTLGALKTCFSVVSVALSVENAFSDVAEAVEGLADAGSIKDGIKNGISGVKAVDDSVESIQSGYAAIQSLIEPDTHPDGGKLLTYEASYDAWVDQNIVGAAQEDALKSAARRYFDLVKTRNNNVLTYNAALLQKERLVAEMAQQTAAFEAIAAELAAQANPGDPNLTAMVQAADVQTRTYLLRRINDEIRALNYWTVNNDGGGQAVAMPTSADLDALIGAQTQIAAAIDNAMGAVGLPDVLQGLSITFTREAHPDAFAALAASTDRRLLLRSDIIADGASFPGMAHVAVETVQISLPQYETLQTGYLSARIVHGGSGVFLQQDGSTAVRFSHAIRTALYEYDFGSRQVTCTATLGDPSEGFLGLSPFTDWIIDFGSAGIEIDFETLSSVVLTFTGRCLPAQGI